MNLRLSTALIGALSRGANALYWAKHYRESAAVEKDFLARITYDTQAIINDQKFMAAKEAFCALLEGAKAYAPEEEGLRAIDAESLWERGLEESKKHCGHAALDAALKAQA